VGLALRSSKFNDEAYAYETYKSIHQTATVPISIRYSRGGPGRHTIAITITITNCESRAVTAC